MQRCPSQCQICEEHNQPKDVLIQPDRLKEEFKQVCRQCSDIFYGIKPAQSIKNLNQGLIQSFETQVQQNSNCMNEIIDSLISIREALNKKVESLINEIRNQIQNQDDILKQCKVQIFQQQAIKQLHEKYISILISFQNNTIKEIQSLPQNNFIQNIKLLENLDLSRLKESCAQLQKSTGVTSQFFQQSQIKDQDNSNQIKRYQYWSLSKSTLKHVEDIKSISCNRDVSIVAVGYDKNIKVYQFQNEQLKEIYQIAEITNCLKFINDSQLISGGTRMYILRQQNNQQWIGAHDIYIGRSRVVLCLIIKLNQNQLIFVDCEQSQNTRVNFQKLNENNIWIFNQRFEQKAEDYVYSLSLNDSNTKLISSVKSRKIFLWENDGNEWLITQQIHVEQYGFRLCFINESEFVFLPYCSESLLLYSFNNPNKLCEKINQFPIKYGKEDCVGFPIQFIKSKNLLIVKNSNFVNILRKQENSTFILDQSIEFKNYFIQGCVSDDGSYLLIYDKDSKELQVKKLIIMK